MKFAENFAFYRKKLNLTQEELAERLFVTRQTVSRWENGAVVPDAELLIRICDIFGCDLDTLVRKDPCQSEVAESCPKKLTDDNKSYDRHMNKFALFVALGVALILMGVTQVLFLGAFPSLELISVVLLFLFIFSAVALFVFQGISHTSFMRENPSVAPYPSDAIKSFSRKFSWYIIIATGLIVLGLIFIIITNYSEKSIPVGFDKTLWEHLTVGIFMSLVTVAVFLYVYSGILYSKYNVAGYNEECKNEGFCSSEENEKIKKNKSIADAICGAIMMGATALFLMFGFFFNAWHPAWAVFPIGGICCGIFSMLYDAFKK